MRTSVSLIVPTLRRKNSLFRLLGSLKQIQEFTKDIIVVEQGEKNKSEIERFVKKLGIENFSYYFLKEISTSSAKNFGASVAKGDLILFLDDDVLVSSDLIKFHTSNFADQQVAAVTGRAITVGQPVQAEYNNTGRITLFGVFTDGFSSSIKQEVDTVIGCNACWRKDLFMELGGFDEKFIGNALREESDLSLRTKRAGYKVIFEPNALVVHVRESLGGTRKTEGRMKWYFDFFSNEVYFFLKNRPKILLSVYLLMRSEWAFRCMFGFGREVSFRSVATPLSGVIGGIKKYVNRN